MVSGPARWTDTNIKGRTEGMSPWITVCTSLSVVILHNLWIYSRASFAPPNTSAQRNFNDVALNRKVCVTVCPRIWAAASLCSRWLILIKEWGNLFPGFYSWEERGCQHRSAHQEECIVHKVRVLCTLAGVLTALWGCCTASESQGNQEWYPEGLSSSPCTGRKEGRGTP